MKLKAFKKAEKEYDKISALLSEINRALEAIEKIKKKKETTEDGTLVLWDTGSIICNAYIDRGQPRHETVDVIINNQELQKVIRPKLKTILLELKLKYEKKLDALSV